MNKCIVLLACDWLIEYLCNTAGWAGSNNAAAADANRPIIEETKDIRKENGQKIRLGKKSRLGLSFLRKGTRTVKSKELHSYQPVSHFCDRSPFTFSQNAHLSQQLLPQDPRSSKLPLVTHLLCVFSFPFTSAMLKRPFVFHSRDGRVCLSLQKASFEKPLIQQSQPRWHFVTHRQTEFSACVCLVGGILAIKAGMEDGFCGAERVTPKGRRS